jgi:hypothetical protein
MKEYVISGHSGSTGEIFEIPKNVSLIFYAEQEQTCYVPNDKESLDIVINSMSDLKTRHNTGEQVNNYEILFMENHMFEGISEIERNQYGIQNYNFFYPERDNEGYIKLSEICELLKNNNVGENIKLYCVFCRGSQREFSDMSFENFENIDADQLFLNETPFGINPQGVESNELDSFDFDSTLFGGGNKTNKHRYKRKTSRKKTSRKKTSRKKTSRRKKSRRKTSRRK